MILRVLCMVALVLGVLVDTAKLPSYIKPCHRNDPNMKQCVLKNGQDAIASIVKGDKSYKVPNMLPMLIPKIEFEAGQNLKIKLTDSKIYGLEDTIFKDANLDWKNKHYKIEVYIPRTNLLGPYEIDGRILIVPIQGKGPANITFIGSTFTYEYDYKLIEINGKLYQDVVKSDVRYHVERAYFKLENLFNGDKRLGIEMNRFLDENWEAVLKDIGPALGETVGQIITSLITVIQKKVPDEEIILN